MGRFDCKSIHRLEQHTKKQRQNWWKKNLETMKCNVMLFFSHYIFLMNLSQYLCHRNMRNLCFVIPSQAENKLYNDKDVFWVIGSKKTYRLTNDNEDQPMYGLKLWQQRIYIILSCKLSLKNFYWGRSPRKKLYENKQIWHQSVLSCTLVTVYDSDHHKGLAIKLL
jgi:hypothetical protein